MNADGKIRWARSKLSIATFSFLSYPRHRCNPRFNLFLLWFLFSCSSFTETIQALPVLLFARMLPDSPPRTRSNAEAAKK